MQDETKSCSHISSQNIKNKQIRYFFKIIFFVKKTIAAKIAKGAKIRKNLLIYVFGNLPNAIIIWLYKINVNKQIILIVCKVLEDGHVT